MSGKRVKILRRQLIKILGTLPTKLEFKHYKRKYIRGEL